MPSAAGPSPDQVREPRDQARAAGGATSRPKERSGGSHPTRPCRESQTKCGGPSRRLVQARLSEATRAQRRAPPSTTAAPAAGQPSQTTPSRLSSSAPLRASPSSSYDGTFFSMRSSSAVSSDS
eukprot:scaffold57200_cov27-Prasinocladus_malaysianus.AAC.1